MNTFKAYVVCWHMVCLAEPPGLGELWQHSQGAVIPQPPAPSSHSGSEKHRMKTRGFL